MDSLLLTDLFNAKIVLMIVFCIFADTFAKVVWPDTKILNILPKIWKQF